jgi:hypothetical protein
MIISADVPGAYFAQLISQCRNVGFRDEDLDLDVGDGF